jgi:hypothetical protein
MAKAEIIISTSTADAARLFVDFLLSTEAQIFMRERSLIPSGPDVAPDPPELTRGLRLIRNRPFSRRSIKRACKGISADIQTSIKLPGVFPNESRLFYQFLSIWPTPLPIVCR